MPAWLHLDARRHRLARVSIHPLTCNPPPARRHPNARSRTRAAEAANARDRPHATRSLSLTRHAHTASAAHSPSGTPRASSVGRHVEPRLVAVEPLQSEAEGNADVKCRWGGKRAAGGGGRWRVAARPSRSRSNRPSRRSSYRRSTSKLGGAAAVCGREGGVRRAAGQGEGAYGWRDGSREEC